MRCQTEGCSGKYMPIKMVCEGLGGAVVVEVPCDGCLEGSQHT